jgi:hypothetical protein
MARPRARLGQNDSPRKEFLKLFEIVPPREFDERFAAVTFGEIYLKNVLQERGHFTEGNAFKNFTANSGVRTCTPAEHDVIAFT